MLTYAEYIQMTLNPVTEQQFGVLLNEAEIYLESWTLGRASESDRVKLVLAKMVDGLFSMYDSSKALLNGESVKSYSNGVSSWSFDTPFSGSVESFEQTCKQGMYLMAVELLPTEMVSRVVGAESCE